MSESVRKKVVAWEDNIFALVEKHGEMNRLRNDQNGNLVDKVHSWTLRELTSIVHQCFRTASFFRSVFAECGMFPNAQQKTWSSAGQISNIPNYASKVLNCITTYIDKNSKIFL